MFFLPLSPFDSVTLNLLSLEVAPVAADASVSLRTAAVTVAFKAPYACTCLFIYLFTYLLTYLLIFRDGNFFAIAGKPMTY